jgi:cellulose synthase/poly-beta-1,6-N-acetylglucosamine synthase-like glycosyltransferase
MLGALLWWWVAVLLLYWAFIAVGIRRFELASRRPESAAPVAPTKFDLVIPAYNEASHLPLIARALCDARAAGLAAIVIDDGSRDGSAGALAALCERNGAHLLRHSFNRGKAAALRSGLNVVRARDLMTLDADTTIALSGAVLRRVGPEVGAVAFTIVAADTGRFLSAAQAAEYAYVLNLERMAFAGYGVVLTVPGAASLWRAEGLREIGGFSSRTCAEDTDATLTLQLNGWQVAVADEVVATTECPPLLHKLIRQRARWIWGNLQAAYYAAVACLRNSTTVRRAPALVMISASLFVLGGYAIATATLIRVLMLDIGRSDIAASAVLFVATAGRISLTRRLLVMPKRGLIATLVFLLWMQAINFVGFWYGALSRRSQW